MAATPWRRWRDSNSRALIRCLLHFECRPFNRLGTSPHIFFSWNFVSKPLVFGERLLPGKAHRCWFQAVPHHRPCKATELISSADPSTTWVHLHDIHFSVAMTSQRPPQTTLLIIPQTPSKINPLPPTPAKIFPPGPGQGVKPGLRLEPGPSPEPALAPAPAETRGQPPAPILTSHAASAAPRPGNPRSHAKTPSRTGRPLPGPRRRPP